MSIRICVSVLCAPPRDSGGEVTAGARSRVSQVPVGTFVSSPVGHFSFRCLLLPARFVSAFFGPYLLFVERRGKIIIIFGCPPNMLHQRTVYPSSLSHLKQSGYCHIP